MDALSIVVASVGLVSVCGKLSGHISWLTNKFHGVHKGLEALISEIGVFSEVLEDIGGVFCDPSVANSVLAAKTGHEDEHWRDVKQAMEECKRMLEDLHENLQPSRSPLHGGKRLLIDITSEELSRSHHQIMAYRRTMEVSQDIIKISFMLGKSSLDPGLPSKLEQVCLDLKDLSRYIREDPTTDSPRINCLERCLSSAGRMVSMASSIVDLRSKRRMKQEITSFETTHQNNKYSYKSNAIPNSSLYRSTSNEVLRPVADILTRRPRGASVTKAASASPIGRHLPNFPTDLSSAHLRIDTSSNSADSRYAPEFPTPPDSTSQFAPRGRAATPANRYAPPSDLPSPPMSDMSTSPTSYGYPPNPPSQYSTRDTSVPLNRPNFPSPLTLPSPALENDISSNATNQRYRATNPPPYSMTRDTSPSSSSSLSHANSPTSRGMSSRTDRCETPGNIFQPKFFTPRDILQRRSPSTDTTTSTVNTDEIGRWFKFGSKNFAAKEYGKAEPFLDRVLKESDIHSEWREETMRMMVLIYGKTGRLTEANDLLNQRFEGRDGTIETLASELCQERRWEEVVRILHHDFQARENVLERVSRAFVMDSKWSDARSVLIELIKYGAEDTMKGLERMSVLADVCWARGDLDDTKRWCVTAIRGEKSVLDKGNPLFAQFVKILVQVCEAQEDAEGVANYSALLSFDVQYCAEIERLHLLKPKDAATQVEKGFKDLPRTNKQKKSIRDNIVKGKGLTGSGYGWSLMHSFAANGRHLALQLLLDKGAQVDPRDEQGNTPLNCAALEGHEATVRMLLKRGADHSIRNKMGNTSVMSATLKGSEKVIKLLLDGGADVETRDKDQNTILMSAVMDKFYKVVKLLIQRGAKLEAKNQAGRTAFMLAVLLGDERSVKLLLQKGVPIETKDNEGNTPLMLATKNEHNLPIVELLLAAGADIAARNNNGHTALYIAKKSGVYRTPIVRTLLLWETESGKHPTLIRSTSTSTRSRSSTVTDQPSIKPPSIASTRVY